MAIGSFIRYMAASLCLYMMYYSYNQITSLERCRVISLTREPYGFDIEVPIEKISEKVIYTVQCNDRVLQEVEYHIDSHWVGKIIEDEFPWDAIIAVLIIFILYVLK